MIKQKLLSFIAATTMVLWASGASAQSSNERAVFHQEPGPQRVLSLSKEKSPQNNVPKQLAPAAVIKKAETSKFFGRTVYGSLINSTEWSNASIAEVPYGIYSFEMNDSPAMTSHLTHLYYDFIAGANGRGKFYGVTALSVMGAFNGSRHIALDTKNWKEIAAVLFSPDTRAYSLLAAVMAYNPVDDQIYALQYNTDLTGLNWSKYDKETNDFVQISTFRSKFNVLTLAATPDGGMYLINEDGDLYSVDKSNGKASYVGATGVKPTLYNQSMVYDGKTATFLWAAQTADGSALYSINPKNAVTSKILDFQNSEEFTSLYSEDNEALDDAPAGVKDLKLTYDSEGGYSGKITFTVPTTTYSGNALGKVKLNVWLDGNNLKGTDENAGSAISIPVTLTDGNHYVAVNTSNDGGYSPMATVYQFAGYDTPLKATNVTFTTDKSAKTNKIVWTAPEKGVNDGFIDKANLKYTVVRMPDSVTVASNISETSFTENIPAAMHNYSYRVYTINHDKTSAYAESNALICGNAFTVPYEQDFTSTNTLGDFFTVIDANNDNNTWRNGWGGEIRIDISSYTGNGDDWLITPPITMEAGMKYRYSINMRTFSEGYPEKFKVYVGTNPNDLSTFKLLDQQDNFQQYDDFHDYNVDFNIDKSGDYYVGFYYCGDVAQNSAMLRVKSVAVNKIGASKAPAAVADLNVTPDAKDALAATVSFTTPNKNLQGDAISSLSKVDVYRNNEASPAHSFNAPAVGTKLSWNDTNVPSVGITTYTVVPSNANGAGESLSASAFVGVYTTPYNEKFNTEATAKLYSMQYKGIATGNNYGWSYDKTNKYMSFNCFVMGDSIVSAWLYTPAIKLDADAVYNVSYSVNTAVCSKTVTNDVYAGLAPDSSAQTIHIGALPLNTNYQFASDSHQLVTNEAGKYYLGFNSIGRAQWDYMSMSLDSVTVTYLRSARTPYVVTNYKSESVSDGSLMTNISFNAPKVDYKGEALKEITKIDIYRGESAIPVYTISNPNPGAALSWTDIQPVHGINHYTIVPSNSYGRGEAYLDTIFVGRDVAEAVSNYRLRGSSDNVNGILKWTAPTKGKNGGVVVPDELTYTVVSYDINTQKVTVLAEGVKDTTYTVEHAADDAQAVYYYGVVCVNTEGVGGAALRSIVLGKLYDMPFNESFANQTSTTSPWLIRTDIANAYTWGLTNPDGKTYNSATAEDNDDGCAYMYNGNYYAVYNGAGFFSPKMSTKGYPSKLTFWVYNVKTSYDLKPAVVVKVCANDGDLEQVGDTIIVGGDTEDGWKEYTLSLDKYKDADYFYIDFEGLTSGHSDIIFLDNIQVAVDATAINGLNDNGKAIRSTVYYDLNGRIISTPAKGVFIKSVTFEDGTMQNVKIVKK
jgi:hypothetical protein